MTTAANQQNRRRKWLPPHTRAPCWVAEHRRQDGVIVKRHWRSGATVKGHYATVCPNPSSPAVRRTRWPATVSRSAKAGDHRDILVVKATPNNAAMAAALETLATYRIASRAPARQPAGEAVLTDVLWTATDGQRNRAGAMACALGSVRLPDEPARITLEIQTKSASGATARYRLDTAIFINDDLSIAAVPGADADPETVVRLLDKVQPKGDAPVEKAQRRNRVRQRLGHASPEQSVYHAIRDTLAAMPLPDLPVTQPFTIKAPGTGYHITITPDAS